MKTISVKLSDGLARELSVVAGKLGSSKSDVVRVAIEDYMRGSCGAGRLSCFDLASDIIGSAEGPADLATAPDYFEDFGQ